MEFMMRSFFIIVHQIYELWFKEILHETNVLKDHFVRDNSQEIFRVLKIVRVIVKVLVSQFDILETISPEAFAVFRGHLGGGSGFQSKQFRAIENAFGVIKESFLKKIDDIHSYSTV